MIKRVLYIRSAPYKVNLNLYNLQEIGFSKELCKRGIDCDIIYYSDENKDQLIYEYKNKKVTILWRKGIRILRTGIYPKILNNEFMNKYDLIITTEYGQIMSLLCSKYNSKVVLYNGPYYNMFKIPIVEKLYDRLFVKYINSNMNKIFTKSKLSKEFLESKGFTNIETIGVGLDTSVFEQNIEVSDDVKYIIDFMSKNKCLLYVGSLDDRKNFRFLLTVFEKINKINSKIKLIVVGNGRESYVNKSFNMIDKKVLSNILHIKQIDNKYLKYIYSEADIFILPSKLEIFGMVLLEAMYFGTPIISSVNGGSITLIEDGINGLVIDNFSEEEWRDKIISLLENDEYRESIGKEAKATIIDKYTWNSISERFITLLES